MVYDEEKIIVPKFDEASGFYTTKKRSKIMGRIRAKNTKPELRFRRALWAKKVRYRINNKLLPGKPDISIIKYKIAIFIDGEYWHGYNWEDRRSKISTNRDFWIPKIERNMQRDREINYQLSSMGFTVFRFWEHEVNNQLDKCINDVMEFLITGTNR